MEELEITYLAKYIPGGVFKSPFNEILDIYIPSEDLHPVLRIRKSGNKYEITKKEPINQNDSSRQLETTIPLNEREHKELASLQGKRIRKLRYYYDMSGIRYEIDIFQDDLKGLVQVDVEFDTEEGMKKLKMPDFCLADVTQEKFMAGGMLCGKKYSDIEKDLARFGYRKL